MKVEIICDSIAPSGVRITTFSLTYPRIIHSELMTHRVFSRNASSSRAIPLKKQIEYLKQNYYKPSDVRKNQRGMQGFENVDAENLAKGQAIWYMALQDAIKHAEALGVSEADGGLGWHKQVCNRLLEPFMFINVLVTSTNYSNFFALRDHRDAQPEIQELTKLMKREYNSNKPTILREGEWHLPYVTEVEKLQMNHTQQIKKSVACCARVSYKTFDGQEPTMESCEKIYDKLLGSSPIHASPAEHQAMALSDAGIKSGNLQGWQQYRKTLKGEFLT